MARLEMAKLDLEKQKMSVYIGNNINNEVWSIFYFVSLLLSECMFASWNIIILKIEIKQNEMIINNVCNKLRKLITN